MNIKFKKLAPNAWVLESPERLEIGKVAYAQNKYGKDVGVIPFKELVRQTRYNANNEVSYFWFYSYIREDGKNVQTRAKERAEKYAKWAKISEEESQRLVDQVFTSENKAFFSLGQPILVGHHSEKRHRRFLKSIDDKMRKSWEFSNKAKEHEYRIKHWESMQDTVNLGMPESLEYYEVSLELAKEHHQFLKDNPKERDHDYSLTYANKKVKELKKLYDLAVYLWGVNNLEEGL